jgi:Lectin C-type domain
LFFKDVLNKMKTVSKLKQMVFRFVLFFVLGCTVELSAQIPALNTLQSAYSNKVAKLESDQQTKKNLAIQEYGNDLNNALKAVQQAGDFDGYVLVEKEVNRFKAEKSVPDSSGIPQVSACLKMYHKKLEKLTAEASARKIELCKQYLEALIALRKDLMIQNKMKDASVVNDMVKQVEVDIKDMESWGSSDGTKTSGASKPETRLDELFGDDPPKTPARPDGAEVKTPPKVSAEVKKSKKGPPEAIHFNGHFYQYCADKIKWDTAKAKCQMRGGHLATIESSEENDFVSKMVEGKSGVWIGLYKPTDAWRWVTTEKFVYSNWSPGQPSITKRSSRLGVYTCCVLKGVERYCPPSYVDGMYKEGYTVNSGVWEDAYGDAPMEGYICEWDE